VQVTQMRDLQRVYQWLQRGVHPFRSVTIDSLSELQKRIVDEVSGTDQLAPQDWGKVFRRGDALVRSCRDLPRNPVKPLDRVCYLTGTSERGRSEVKVGPYVSGQLGATLPGFVDVVGLLHIEDNDDGERHLLQVHERRGTTTTQDAKGKDQSVPWKLIAKDRTHTFTSGVVDVTWSEEGGWVNTIESMMTKINETIDSRESGNMTTPTTEREDA